MKSRFGILCLAVLCFNQASSFNDYVLRDLGCWKDTSERSIPSIENSLQGPYNTRPNAIQECAHAARNLGYTVFAVQNGGLCASSQDAMATYKKYEPYDQCASDGKGGPWANQVYEIETVFKVNYRPVGCFKDESTRAIATIEEQFVDLHDSYQKRGDAMGKCGQSAAALGHTVFALQHGGWCASSSNAHLTYNKYGPSDDCETHGKGGGWANAVYEITDVTKITLSRLGCFKDNESRALPFLEIPEVLPGKYTERPHAIEQCVRYAFGLGFSIVGIQNGGSCMAGKDYDRYGHSTACKSNSKGGPWANEVFRWCIEKLDIPLPVLPVHQHHYLNNLGCWTDKKARAIPVELEGQPILIGLYKTRKDAIQRCAQAAVLRGFNIIGVQNGGQCWSGMNAKNNTYRMYGTSSKCHANGRGGAWSNQVYEINTIFNPVYIGLGCYKDTAERSITLIENTQPSLSDAYATRSDAVRKCALAAAGQGYEIFGVQNGGQCGTSANAGSRYMIYGPANNCGNGRGGAWSNDVYKILEGLEFHIMDRGCWADDSFRTIPLIEAEVPEFALQPKYRDRKDAVAKCAREAFNRAFNFFALQNGGQCASSDDAADTYMRLGPSQKCGNDGKGGSWANQVYEIIS